MLRRRHASISLVLVVLLVATTLLAALPVQAQSGGAESEPNDTAQQAQVLSTIGLNAPLNATIGRGGDVDWYAFEATAGRTYVVELFDVGGGLRGSGRACNGFSNPGVGIQVLDTQNKPLETGCDASSASAANTHNTLAATTPTSGRHYIKIIANDTAATGAYRLRVLPRYDQPGAQWDAQLEPNNTWQTAYAITPGYTNALTSSFEARDPSLSSYRSDRDWYRFDAVAGLTYVVEVFNAASALGEEGRSCNGYTNTGVGILLYNASVRQVEGDCAANGRGGSMADTHHLLRFQAEATGVTYIQLIPNNDNVAGSYSLRVLPKYDEPGAGWDSATFEPNNSSRTAYLITPGYSNALTSRFEPRGSAFSTYYPDIDWYRFEAFAGRTYVVELFNAAADLAGVGAACNGYNNTGVGLIIYNPSLAEVDGSCNVNGIFDAGGNVHQFVSFIPRVSGIYTIKLTPNKPDVAGTYSLRILPKYNELGAGWDSSTYEPNNVLANSYPIGVGPEKALASLIEPREASYSTFSTEDDWYRFEAVENQTYVVELFDVAAPLAGSGTSCNGYNNTGLGLVIYNPSGDGVAGSCASSGPTGPGRIHHRTQYKTTVNGTFHIRVSPNSPSASGSYSLRVCQNACPTGVPPTVTIPTSGPTSTVPPQPTPTVPTVPITPTWLVMLYLGGDDATQGGLNEATRLLLQRLNRMPHNPALRLVVLFDGGQVGDSRLYLHQGGRLQDVTEQAASSPLWIGGMGGQAGQRELDTGSVSTIRNFVAWARGTYTGNRYTMLSIIDHGGGWAPDLDPPAQPRGRGRVQAGGWRGMSLDINAGGSSLSTRSTGEALKDLGNFDLLFFDACLMGMIESAYEVRDVADYFVAGQNLLFADLPYHDYLASTGLTDQTTPQQLAQRIVNRYNRTLSAQKNPFTISALDLRQLRSSVPNNLPARVNTLATHLLAALPDPAPATNPLVQAITQIYSQTQKFDYDASLTIDPREGYVDLVDFARRISTSTDASIPADAKTAAAEVVAAALEGSTPVVVAHRAVNGLYEKQEWSFNGANGIAIFLPLGERDYRPTKIDQSLPDRPAWAERQLAYYADPAQLAFTKDVPQWAALLVRLETSVPIIRAPGGLPGVQLAQQALIDDRPFNVPVPVTSNKDLFVPMIVR